MIKKEEEEVVVVKFTLVGSSEYYEYIISIANKIT